MPLIVATVNWSRRVGRETELKLKLVEPAALRARLSGTGAQRGVLVEETNRLFDTPGRRLLAQDAGLRLRTSRPHASGRTRCTLTYKGPRSAGVVKSREEIEFHVDDAEAAATLLAHLGYAEVIRYEKRREVWRLVDCEIAIDELPLLGWYVEIEGPDEIVVQDVRRQLNLGDAVPVDETYPHLTAEYGTPSPTGGYMLEFS
jgi:adenylate cyclase class 2